MSVDLERYSRQMRFAGIGQSGQEQLRTARVLLCGCGALGTVLADTLVRAGIGSLRIVDRDFVDLSNLQRQVLFDEQDVAAHWPKAVAAAEKLRAINSQVVIEPIVADVGSANVLGLFEGIDLVLDATDNFETRFLLNDAAHETRTPWVYAGCVGSQGQSMMIIPGETACLRCLMELPPEPGTTETCDTAGVIAPAIHAITAVQSTAALKYLSGQKTLIAPRLTILDVWAGTHRTVDVSQVFARSGCPACHQGERLWLRGERTSQAARLCGRNAVQITPAEPTAIVLDTLAAQWATLGRVTRNPFLIRLTLSDPDREITLFPDGRAIVQGTEDIATARSWYARYVGG